MSKYNKNQKKLLPKNEYFQKIMTVEQLDNSLFTPIASQQTIKKSVKTSLSSKYVSPFVNKYAPQQSNVIAKSMSHNIKKTGTSRGIPSGGDIPGSSIVDMFFNLVVDLMDSAGTSLETRFPDIPTEAIQKIAQDTGYSYRAIQDKLNDEGVFRNFPDRLVATIEDVISRSTPAISGSATPATSTSATLSSAAPPSIRGKKGKNFLDYRVYQTGSGLPAGHSETRYAIDNKRIQQEINQAIANAIRYVEPVSPHTVNSNTSASASIPSSATTASSITPDASSLPTTSDSSSSFNPFVVPPTAPQPPSAISKIVQQLTQLPSDIKNSKEFKQVMRELTRLPKDIKRGNAIPRLLNALSTSQRNADIAAGRNAAIITRNPLGEFAGNNILASKLPLVTAKQLEEDASLRNPFNRPGYVSDFLGDVNVRSSNPYMQDLQYLFNHYWNDPRARSLRSAGQLGAGLSLASAIGSQLLPPLYNFALNAYNSYTKTPEKNNQTNTPSSTVTQQDVESMKPILPKYPDKYYELANKMAIQDVAENFNRQFFGKTGKGDLIFQQPIFENYKRILPTLFPENASKFQEISQNLINSYAPLFMSKSPATTVNPYEGKQEKNYVLSRVKELKQNRIKQQLKDFYENEIPNIRTENYMLSDEDVNTILASKAKEFANSYGEKEYKKDASLALSELQSKMLRNTYNKMSEFIYPIAEKEFDRGRKYDWYDPEKWFPSKVEREYFIPPGEKDKIILQNSNLVNFNTQPKPPEYFESLFTTTPKYPEPVKDQYQYPGKPNDIPSSYPGLTQKRLSPKRSPKKQPHDIIQKSLAPKYQPVSKNKYLKEK